MDDFAKIYDEHVSSVRSILFRMCPAAEVDDLTQECFLKAWKSRETYRQEASLAVWIRRIAVNTAYDAYRRKAARPRTEELIEETSVDARAELGLAQSENQQIVRLALQNMSEEHRTVFVLHVFEELSIEEIAQILEVAAGTVKSRLFYARTEAKKFLHEKGISYGS